MLRRLAAPGEAFGHVDDTLVAGAAELEFQGTLRHHEGAVNQDVGKGEQFENSKLTSAKCLNDFPNSRMVEDLPTCRGRAIGGAVNNPSEIILPSCC